MHIHKVAFNIRTACFAIVFKSFRGKDDIIKKSRGKQIRSSVSKPQKQEIKTIFKKCCASCALGGNGNDFMPIIQKN